jgi:pimeloyl-ACP methyl ester carboxylesterase
MGLYSYAQFLAEINKHDALGPSDGEIGIIALEMMPISFRITQPILARNEMCRQIKAILDHHGFDKVVLASHSYGSVITTHLLQDPTIAPRIGPMLLVDPVTFLLHLPDVAYNFTARKPRKANEHQLYYFASTDMMVAHTLARHFFWAQNILWKEDLGLGDPGRHVTVSLGGRDLIVATEVVGKYLNRQALNDEDCSWKEREWNGSGLETIWWPTCDHAQVFERSEGRRRLGEVVRQYTQQRHEEHEDV